MQAAAFIGKIFPSTTVKEKAEQKDDNDILLQINETLDMLKNIQNRFNFETEPDLIEACIFEEHALKARYRHLIDCAKSRNITCSPVQKPKIQKD